MHVFPTLDYLFSKCDQRQPVSLDTPWRVPFGTWIWGEPDLARPARGALGESVNVSLEMAGSSHGLPKPVRSALRGMGTLVGKLVRVVGLEPTLPCGNQILHPTMAFATLASAVIRLGGLMGWTLSSPWAFAVRWLPLSLYTFPIARAWLGVGIVDRRKRSPSLTANY
jgi:hypothetical protein